MQKVLILRGLPASGKTTYAKSIQNKNIDGSWKRINKDDLRAMLDNSKYSHASEAFINKIQNTLISKTIKEGYNLILDNTNMREDVVKNVISIIKNLNLNIAVEIEIKYFNVNVEECIDRDADRKECSVGKDVILKMHNQYNSKNFCDSTIIVNPSQQE